MNKLQNTCYLLHGFPGFNSKKMLTTISGVLKSLPHSHSEVIHYPGLHNTDAQFGFSRSIEAVYQHIQHSISQDPPDKIFLIGHSWGGFVSLAVAKKLNLPSVQVILLAPFTHLASADQPTRLLSEVHKMYPEQFPENALPELINELRDLVIGMDFQNDTHVWLTEKQLTLILAKQDSVFTPAHLDEFLAQFKDKTYNFIALEDDHSFTLAPEKLTEIIVSLVKRG